MVPTLAGVHHLKLPVSDLDRSIAWYGRPLGYQVVIEFRRARPPDRSVDGAPGRRTAARARHAPERAGRPRASTTSPSECPNRVALERLAARLTALGEQHAGVHFATVGWILPMLHDPDGHEVRFYSMEAHADVDPDTPIVVDDARSSAEGQGAVVAGPAASREPGGEGIGLGRSEGFRQRGEAVEGGRQPFRSGGAGSGQDGWNRSAGSSRRCA